MNAAHELSPGDDLHRNEKTFAPYIELLRVSKTFNVDIFKPAQKSLVGLDLAIGKNLCTALLGHNGAGKTTTIRILLGILKPSLGEIIVHRGSKLGSEGFLDREQLGYMPEVNKLPANLTGLDLVSYQLKITQARHKLNRHDLKEKSMLALRDAGIPDKSISKKIRQLSKGMARRVAWAYATVHDPEFLVLDEPSSGLDPYGRSEMTSWIARAKAAQKTILLCTHDLEQVRLLAECIYVLKQGSVSYSNCIQAQNDADDERAWRYSTPPQVSELVKFFSP